MVGVVTSEPDRMTGSLNLGSRVMLSREGLERTGLMAIGSRGAQRFLFRLPEKGINLDEMRGSLKKAFPDALIADYRESHPAIRRALERSTTFLSLVSLIALVVGGLGVATSVHAHMQQRLDTIAILKCLGARSSQIIAVYGFQAAMLGLAGGAGGIVVGFGVQRALPFLLAKFSIFELRTGGSRTSRCRACWSACWCVCCSACRRSSSIREVKPALIFRREIDAARRSWRTSAPEGRPPGGRGDARGSA